MSSPFENNPEPKYRPNPPSWIPAWMGERERMALILALGIVLAALVVTCGGCCGEPIVFRILNSFN